VRAGAVPVVGAEAGWLRTVAMGLRWGALVVAGALILLDRRPVAAGLLVTGGMLLAAVAIWRAGHPDPDSVAGRNALLLETTVALAAVVVTGGWESPYTLSLAAPVLLLAVQLDALRVFGVVAGALLALAVTDLVDTAPSDPGAAAQTITLLGATAAAGWVVRRALLQAEEEHDRTLGRVQQLGHVNAMLSTLHDLVRSMPAPLTVDEIVGVIRRQLDELFEADTVVLLLADGGRERWRPVYAEGVRVAAELGTADLPAPVRERGPAQRPVVVDALAAGEGLRDASRSGAYLWLWMRGQPSGLLVLEHDRVAGIPGDQRDTLERLSVPLALAIDNAVWFQRLRTVGAEEERQRIGAALHDRFAQSLVYIAMALDRTFARHPDDRELEALRSDVRDTLADLRETLRELRLKVTEDQGLVPVLEEHLERFGQRFGLLTTLEADREDPLRPALAVEQQLLRIVQELLALAEREGGATSVRVKHATGPGWLRIVVADDGRGIPLPDLGAEASERLQVVRERADAIGATVDVTTSPGEGSEVTVMIRGLL
jgi:signal transduction histidine kinase